MLSLFQIRGNKECVLGWSIGKRCFKIFENILCYGFSNEFRRKGGTEAVINKESLTKTQSLEVIRCNW
jgi:hypothetical protein